MGEIIHLPFGKKVNNTTDESNIISFRFMVGRYIFTHNTSNQLIDAIMDHIESDNLYFELDKLLSIVVTLLQDIILPYTAVQFDIKTSETDPFSLIAITLTGSNIETISTEIDINEFDKNHCFKLQVKFGEGFVVKFDHDTDTIHFDDFVFNPSTSLSVKKMKAIFNRIQDLTSFNDGGVCLTEFGTIVNGIIPRCDQREFLIEFKGGVL